MEFVDGRTDGQIYEMVEISMIFRFRIVIKCLNFAPSLIKLSNVTFWLGSSSTVKSLSIVRKFL